MNISKSVFALAVAGALMPFAASATPSSSWSEILTFDRASACTGTCVYSTSDLPTSTISNSYGDLTGQVNVTYSSNVSGSTRSLRYYDAGGQDMVVGQSGGVNSITITGDSGGLVSLTGFDFAQASVMTSATTFVVLDVNGSQLWSTTVAAGTSVNALSHLSLSGLSSSSLTLRWSSTVGAQSALIALDNISISAIPEPTTLALFAAGLGAVGAARRRKAAAAKA